MVSTNVALRLWCRCVCAVCFIVEGKEESGPHCLDQRGLEAVVQVCGAATYADVCGRMRTYADVCGLLIPCSNICGRMLTYADVYAVVQQHMSRLTLCMLTYADVCGRMLTYADGC